jgi:hypothetical protein
LIIFFSFIKHKILETGTVSFIHACLNRGACQMSSRQRHISLRKLRLVLRLSVSLSETLMVFYIWIQHTAYSSFLTAVTVKESCLTLKNEPTILVETKTVRPLAKVPVKRSLDAYDFRRTSKKKLLTMIDRVVCWKLSCDSAYQSVAGDWNFHFQTRHCCW